LEEINIRREKMTGCTLAYVPEYSQKRLENVTDGEIILVHSSGMYVRFGAEVFLLCDKSWGVLPIGIGLENFRQAVCLLRPEAGQRVCRQGEMLIFPGGSVSLCPMPVPVQSGGSPRKQLLLQAAKELAALQKTGGLSLLVLPMILGRACPAALEQNPYVSRAYPEFEKLLAALAAEDAAAAEHHTRQLLGLGVGLTPSADDMFLGMLYMFRRLLPNPGPAISRFRNTVFRESEHRSNQISAAYLKALAQGEDFGRLDAVWRYFNGTGPDALAALLEVGSSSGGDLLLSLLAAGKLSMEKEEGTYVGTDRAGVVG
jgi:hypothetical protein